jgi:hypothetical protein
MIGLRAFRESPVSRAEAVSLCDHQWQLQCRKGLGTHRLDPEIPRVPDRLHKCKHLITVSRALRSLSREATTRRKQPKRDPPSITIQLYRGRERGSEACQLFTRCTLFCSGAAAE